MQGRTAELELVHRMLASLEAERPYHGEPVATAVEPSEASGDLGVPADSGTLRTRVDGVATEACSGNRLMPQSCGGIASFSPIAPHSGSVTFWSTNPP